MGSGRSCSECPSTKSTYLYLALVTAGGILFVLLQLYIVLRTSRHLSLIETLRDQSDRTIEERFADYQAALEEEGDFDENALSNSHLAPLQHVPPPDFTHKLKIILGFGQICTNIASSVNINWPKGFQSFSSIFDATNADYISASSIECISNVNFYSRFVTTGLVPLAFFAVFFIVVFATDIFRFCGKLCRDFIFRSSDKPPMLEMSSMSANGLLRAVQDHSPKSLLSIDNAAAGGLSVLEMPVGMFQSTLLKRNSQLADRSRSLFQLASRMAIESFDDLTSSSSSYFPTSPRSAATPTGGLSSSAPSSLGGVTTSSVSPPPSLTASTRSRLSVETERESLKRVAASLPDEAPDLNVNKLRAWRMSLFLLLFLLPSVSSTILSLYQVSSLCVALNVE